MGKSYTFNTFKSKKRGGSFRKELVTYLDKQDKIIKR